MSILEKEMNTRGFIVANYTPYDGDESFLALPTDDTLQLWKELAALMREENIRGGVYDIDENTISTITSHKPGYIHKELEKIVGLQTDAPLKRAIMPLAASGWYIRSLMPMDVSFQKKSPTYSNTAKLTMTVYLMYIRMK